MTFACENFVEALPEEGHLSTSCEESTSDAVGCKDTEAGVFDVFSR